MATSKRPLLSTSGNTTSRLADRVVGLSNHTLSPTANTAGEAAGGQSQPPAGFNGPVPDALTGKLPERATAGSVTSSNADRQATVNEMLGLVDKTSAIDALLGRGGDQGNGTKDRRSDLLSSFGSSQANGMPGMDQGFNKSPDSSALAATAAAGAGNPMNAFRDGSVDGPLADLAGSQAKTPNDFGNDLIAAGEYSNSLLDWIKEKFSDGPERTGGEYLKNSPVERHSSDGRNTTVEHDGGKDVYVNKEFVGHIDKDGNVSDKPKNPKPSVGTPDPENQGVQVRVLSEAILDQLQAAQAGKTTSQGGSSDATPVDDGGLGGVVRDGFIAVNQSSVDGRNLFGQPVGSGGENISGGNKSLNGFGNSNGAGVINPGPDGGTPQGDARFAEDPGSALGGRQTSPDLGGGRTAGGDNGGSSSQAEDLVLNGTTGADTLRGLGGNDTLRGLAGRDILDGGAGRDQLTGGTGADRFRFSAGSSFGLANADRITDFNRAHGDRIEISRQAFSLAAGTSVSFQSVNTDQSLNQALAGGSLFVHDQRDGSLLFNQNGSAAGFGNGGVFANLGTSSALQASDLALIA